MKRLLLLAAICLIINPSTLWATVTTPKNVAVTWTMTDTTDVTGYKIYYADNSAMTNKTLHSDCSDPIENPSNTFTITCNNIILTEGTTYYFTVVAQMNDDSESASNPKDAPFIKPTLVQDFKIVIPGENIAPVAVIFADATNGTAPLTINFNANNSTDSDGSISEYNWNFGDGTTGTGIATNHQFTEGTYTVELTVVDNNGATATDTENITATSPGSSIENIGNQTEATSTKYITPSQIWAYKLPETPNHSGTLKSISITADGAGSPRRFKLALYTHDTANNLPGELVTDSITKEGTVSSDTAQLVTLELESGTPQILSGAQYWVVIQALDGFFQYYRDYDTNGLLVYKNGTAYEWGTWGDSAAGTYTYTVGKCFITYNY